jgi:23S rRNA (uracil1939-C5)-methyltransferase
MTCARTRTWFRSAREALPRRPLRACYTEAVNKPIRIEGRVRDVVASGEAVVETERGIVFARGGLRDERVLLSLDPKPQKPLRGRVQSVLSPAPERVQPVCPHVQRCGGCPLMHASIEQQRALKLGFLREGLRRAGFLAELPLQQTMANQVLAYRRRARLSFQVGAGARKLGYRRERSHELADVDACAVLHPVLAAALVEARLQLLPQLVGEGELALAFGRDQLPVLVVRCREAQPPALYAACEAMVGAGKTAGVALYAASGTLPARFGDATEWSVGLDDVALEGTSGGFSQAHAEINRLLVERVREQAAPPGRKLLELFAGHGNFSVALTKEAAAYTAVEQDAASVAALRRNLSARGLTAKLVEADALTYAIPAGIDVLVLDPPRTGAPGVLAKAADRKVKRVVYVSCDPQTLGRDLNELTGRGYSPTWAEAFEMFPQTADLESLVVLERD